MFRSFAGLRRVPPHYRFLAIRFRFQQPRRQWSLAGGPERKLTPPGKQLRRT